MRAQITVILIRVKVCPWKMVGCVFDVMLVSLGLPMKIVSQFGKFQLIKLTHELMMTLWFKVIADPWWNPSVDSDSFHRRSYAASTKSTFHRQYDQKSQTTNIHFVIIKRNHLIKFNRYKCDQIWMVHESTDGRQSDSLWSSDRLFAVIKVEQLSAKQKMIRNDLQ